MTGRRTIRRATMAAVLCCLALTGCGDAFDEGGAIRADVQRVSHDYCLIAVTPLWGGKSYLARLEGCKP